jgi:hypothetical protein
MLLTIKRCYDWLVAGQGDPRLVAEFRNDVFLLPSIRRSGAARRAHISMERHEEKRKKFIYHSSASSTTRRSPSSHCEIRRHAVDCRSTSARSQIGWDKLPNLNPTVLRLPHSHTRDVLVITYLPYMVVSRLRAMCHCPKSALEPLTPLNLT